MSWFYRCVHVPRWPGRCVPDIYSSNRTSENFVTTGVKIVPGTVPVIDANSVSSSTVLVLSMLHFVRSLRMDGTGYAVTWLKELGNREKGMRG